MNGLLKRAIASGNILEMIYIDSKGNMSQRQIRAIEVKENSLRAYCHFRKQPRVFMLDNVLSIAPVKQRKGA